MAHNHVVQLFSVYCQNIVKKKKQLTDKTDSVKLIIFALWLQAFAAASTTSCNYYFSEWKTNYLLGIVNATEPHTDILS